MGCSIAPNVPVIAFPPLVVVAQDTFTVHHEGQSVFEGVLTAGNGCRQVPQHDLEKGVFIYYRAGLFDQLGLHVVTDNNGQECCQSEQCAPDQSSDENARPAWQHRKMH